MRNIKELLNILCDYIKDSGVKDGMPFGTYNCGGMCCVSLELMANDTIDLNEHLTMNSFLNEEIKKECYKFYPLTHRNCNYGEKNSSFFFERRNWTIRIQWLKEVISKL